MFSNVSQTEIIIVATFNLLSANAFKLDKAKILSLGKELTLCHIIPTFYDPREKALEITVGKRENAGNQRFFPFPTLFFTLSKRGKVILAMFVCKCFQVAHVKNFVVW